MGPDAPSFNARIELPDRVEHAEAVLFVARRLIVQLTGWLASKQLALTRFSIELEHERGRAALPPTTIEVALAEPTWHEEHLTRLLKERLGRVKLAAAVIAVRLEVNDVEAAEPPSDTLFPEPGGSAADHNRLMELLVARLGHENVLRAAPMADHRPEIVSNWVPVTSDVKGCPLPGDQPRPSWLLETPIQLMTRQHRPFYGSPLRTVSPASASKRDGGAASSSRAITLSRKPTITPATGSTASASAAAPKKILGGSCTVCSAEAMDVYTSMLPGYAELQCFSNFTFLRGASHSEELILRAEQLGYLAIAITDECSLAGIVRAHVAAKEANIRLIVGAHFQLMNPDGTPALAFTALAMNRNGYGNLSELITLARTRTSKGTYLLTPSDLAWPQAPYDHLTGLPDCLVILSPEYPAKEERLDAQMEWLARTFEGRCWAALTLHARAMDDIHRGIVEYVADKHGVPVVATGGVTMHVRSRKPLQDTLTAVRLNRSIAECGFELAQNAEQHLRARLRLANLYPERALAETVTIASRCTFSLDELRYEYPDELIPEGTTPTAYLRQETYIGAHRRFPQGIPHKVQTQIEHELALIADLRYEPYFLTVYDLVRFARNEESCVGGAGRRRTQPSATVWA